MTDSVLSATDNGLKVNDLSDDAGFASRPLRSYDPDARNALRSPSSGASPCPSLFAPALMHIINECLLLQHSSA